MTDSPSPRNHMAAHRAGLLARLGTTLGPRGLLTEHSDIAPYGEDWRRL